jgi:hypothetical protein
VGFDSLSASISALFERMRKAESRAESDSLTIAALKKELAEVKESFKLRFDTVQKHFSQVSDRFDSLTLACNSLVDAAKCAKNDKDENFDLIEDLIESHNKLVTEVLPGLCGELHAIDEKVSLEGFVPEDFIRFRDGTSRDVLQLISHVRDVQKDMLWLKDAYNKHISWFRVQLPRDLTKRGIEAGALPDGFKILRGGRDAEEENDERFDEKEDGEESREETKGGTRVSAGK